MIREFILGFCKSWYNIIVIEKEYTSFWALSHEKSRFSLCSSLYRCYSHHTWHLCGYLWLSGSVCRCLQQLSAQNGWGTGMWPWSLNKPSSTDANWWQFILSDWLRNRFGSFFWLFKKHSYDFFIQLKIKPVCVICSVKWWLSRWTLTFSLKSGSSGQLWYTLGFNL